MDDFIMNISYEEKEDTYVTEEEIQEILEKLTFDIR